MMIIGLDNRFGRSFNRTEETKEGIVKGQDRMLGRKQMERFRAALERAHRMAIDRVVVATPTPVFLLSPLVTEVGAAFVVDDLHGT